MKRKRNKKIEWILVGVFVIMQPVIVQAQKSLLTVDAFIQQVRQYHPVAKQANLVTEAASASLLAAKGAFDPVAGYTLDDKTLDGTNYYRYNNAELKIPTPLGIDLKAGFENSEGNYKNPELTTGVASYVGIEIPLLNGLLTDKKRAALKQAKIYESQGEQERLTMINDLLFDAYNAYWQWTGSYKIYNTYKQFAETAAKRFELIKITYRNGDRAMADTIEALSQWENMLLGLSEAALQLRNSELGLSQFLWNESGDPYLLPAAYLPDTSGFEQFLPLQAPDEINKQLAATHPELRTWQYKIESLEVEKKLKFQSLLPTLNLKANALSKDYFTYNDFGSSYLQNNYKLGITMKMPLLLRQGRGDYRNITIKSRQAALLRNQKSWMLQNKVTQYYNEAMARKEQLVTTMSMYRNLSAVLRNEELKFSQGESSLFLINSRENKTLEIQEKLIGLRIKYLKAVYAIDWASGTLR